jgi:hypothetical protein
LLCIEATNQKMPSLLLGIQSLVNLLGNAPNFGQGNGVSDCSSQVANDRFQCGNIIG